MDLCGPGPSVPRVCIATEPCENVVVLLHGHITTLSFNLHHRYKQFLAQCLVSL